MPSPDLEQLALVRQIAASGGARQRRQQARVSLSEIAEACDVCTGTVWKWETGRLRPNGEAAVKYLAVLEQLAVSTRKAAVS